MRGRQPQGGHRRLVGAVPAREQHGPAHLQGGAGGARQEDRDQRQQPAVALERTTRTYGGLQTMRTEGFVRKIGFSGWGEQNIRLDEHAILLYKSEISCLGYFEVITRIMLR